MSPGLSIFQNLWTSHQPIVSARKLLESTRRRCGPRRNLITIFSKEQVALSICLAAFLENVVPRKWEKTKKR
jgi:hypothetical protein